MSHAKLCSPSGAEGWFACPGRPLMEAAFPDEGNSFSEDGTARHEACALALADGVAMADLVGVKADNGVWYVSEWVDEDQDYVDTVRKLAEGGELFIERQVNFETYTGVPGDSFGTADAIILKGLIDGTHELIVIDRKTGHHEVPVENNKQLQLYALGALAEFGAVYAISRVRLIIHQRAAREWDCSIDDLLAFADVARLHASNVVGAVELHGKLTQDNWEHTFLNPKPTEDACRYCKAMAVCPSMQRAVQETVGVSFEDLDNIVEVPMRVVEPVDLADAMAATGMIEDWIKAVRAEVERRLLTGTEVPGFKLVMGKQGNRKWSDEAEAEKQMKAMRLKTEELYDLSLISPTSAEKLAKDKVIGPRQWPKLQSLIVRNPAKPSVAPVTDKRDAWAPAPAVAAFEKLPDESEFA